MHSEKFIHRDLKPHNIFVVETQPYFWVKIGDFGITKRITNDQMTLKTEIGTLDYLAPEVLGYVDEETSRYTNSVDICFEAWSRCQFYRQPWIFGASFGLPVSTYRCCAPSAREWSGRSCQD